MDNKKPCTGEPDCPLCKTLGPPDRVVVSVRDVATGKWYSWSIPRSLYDKIKNLPFREFASGMKH